VLYKLCGPLRYIGPVIVTFVAAPKCPWPGEENPDIYMDIGYCTVLRKSANTVQLSLSSPCVNVSFTLLNTLFNFVYSICHSIITWKKTPTSCLVPLFQDVFDFDTFLCRNENNLDSPTSPQLLFQTIIVMRFFKKRKKRIIEIKPISLRLYFPQQRRLFVPAHPAAAMKLSTHSLKKFLING